MVDIQALYSCRVRKWTTNITADSTHAVRKVFILLSWGRCYRALFPATLESVRSPRLSLWSTQWTTYSLRKHTALLHYYNLPSKNIDIRCTYAYIHIVVLANKVVSDSDTLCNLKRARVFPKNSFIFYFFFIICPWWPRLSPIDLWR